MNAKHTSAALTLTLILTAAGLLTAGAQQAPPAITTPPGFKGTIKLDVRDSTPDWESYTPKKAAPGSPNILVILYDDTGLAAWSPYGGRINMPTMDKLASNGLTYSQWHTCALCSPTRSTFLTGRNHHLNGMAAITEAASGFPGADGRIPDQCVTIGEILQDNGYSTFWLGKDHNVPEQDVASGASRKQWPLQKGFDRYYGFIGGESSQWYPDLVEDNRFVDQPYGPEQGYHLSKDLADHAIAMIRDQKASNPSKPWFMWFCPGANHAPILCVRGIRSRPMRRSCSPVWPRFTRVTPNIPMPKSVALLTTSRKPANSITPSFFTALTTAPPEKVDLTGQSTKTNSSMDTRTKSPRT
jgi:arylsulfatase